MSKTVTLDHFIGKSFVLTAVEMGEKPLSTSYGPEEATTCTFVLNGVIYQAIEDANDGYRSSLGELLALPLETWRLKNEFPPVKVVAERSPDGQYHKNDAVVFKRQDNGLPVLEVGTHNNDDYYPSFVADFQVKNLPGNEGDKVAERELQRLAEEAQRQEEENRDRAVAGWGAF